MRSDAVAPPIRVLVVEDDPVLREDFAATVRAAPGLVLMGVADSVAAARVALGRLGAPDVLLIDLGLPDGDGTQLIRELLSVFVHTSVLVVTVFSDEAHVLRALEAGAHGYLLKDASPTDFVAALHQVRAGGSPLSPQIARHLLKRFAPRAGTPPAAAQRLSAREVEILTWIAQGHTAAEVAARLRLSPHTVTTHVKNIYEKLQVNNRVQAVNRARASGQIP